MVLVTNGFTVQRGFSMRNLIALSLLAMVVPAVTFAGPPTPGPVPGPALGALGPWGVVVAIVGYGGYKLYSAYRDR